VHTGTSQSRTCGAFQFQHDSFQQFEIVDTHDRREPVLLENGNEKPTVTPEEINSLLDAIEDPHDRYLMAIGLFCATRTSETFGLKWKAYGG
jgi:hypothetical protein